MSPESDSRSARVVMHQRIEERRATSNERRATSDKRQATSDDRRAKSIAQKFIQPQASLQNCMFSKNNTITPQASFHLPPHKIITFQSENKSLEVSIVLASIISVK